MKLDGLAVIGVYDGRMGSSVSVRRYWSSLVLKSISDILERFLIDFGRELNIQNFRTDVLNKYIFLL